MAVLQMQKLCICALKKDRKSLMEFLQAAGVLELSAEAEPDEVFKRTDTLEDRQKFERNAATADRALEVLAAAIRYAGSEINPPPPAIASTKPARNTIGQTIINCSIVQSMLHPPKFSCTPKFLLPSQNRNQKALRAYISILIAKTPPVHRY